MILVTCLVAWLQLGAQLVDRATFEQHRVAAHGLNASMRKTNGSMAPVNLSQNPFSIETFTMEPGSSTKQIKVYFNTTVMSSYRTQRCPRVAEFDLMLPSGYSITAVTRGDDLKYTSGGTTYTPITVTGHFDNSTRTLQFLGYGTCTASEMALFPTGRIHYATLTISATNAQTGSYSMTMNNAGFFMADEPADFYVNGTTSFSYNVTSPATGISLNQSTANIVIGNTLQLSATVSPSTASQTVNWSTSNASVATVSSSGVVTAKSVGTATIIATTTDGSNLSATCQVTVTPQLATSITISQTTASIVVDKTLQLSATVTPSNTTNKAVTWSSSNTGIATVSSNGLVTAKAVGSATITVTTADGSNKRATCQVTVTPQLATGVSLNKTSASIVVDKTLQLTATVTPSNTTNPAVTWKSSNTSIATVSSSGLVTAKAVGTATITVTTADGSNKSATCAVTVTPQLATGVSLNKTTASIVVDNTLQLTATVSPSNTTNPAVTWSSSNTSIATVSNTGLVTAKAVGSATITVTTADGSNKSATCAVTVTPQLATGVSLNKTTASIVVDKTLQLSATVSPSNTSNPAVTWSSSNTSIATVSNTGLVTAKALGTATITVTTADGSNKSATCQVTVTPQLAESITLNQTTAEINVGETVTLTATVSPPNTTNPNVKWSTENAAIATVVRGTVRGVGEGECYITATTQDGTNLSATCLVVVSGGSINIQVTNVTLSESDVSLLVGSSTVITATVQPENATSKTLAWSTTKPSVATINANGVLTAVGAGQCDITATSTDGSNVTASCHVTVTDNSVANYLTADDVENVVSGQTIVIPIALINQDPITAIQAELYLPSGIEPNYNDDDQFVWLDDTRKGRGHVVSATINAVATRIMVSSSRNAAFQGNEGTVLYISLKVNPEQVTGVYGIDLKNIILSSTSGEMFEAPNVKINVGVAAYHSGDANGDGYIDDTDYVITANYILAQNPSNFVFSAADMSGDGRVYVNDLPLIIDAAMNFDFDSMSFAPQRAPKRASSTDALYVNDFDLAGGATKTVSIMLDNTTAFSAVQCDIALPNGLTIVQQTDEWGDPAYALLASARSDEHDAWSDITNSDNARIIIANCSNKTLKGTSGAIASFKVHSAAGFSGEHELVLKNIVCADANAVRYALPDAVCLINHSASIAGDVDGNGAVNGTDLNILINIILGKDNAANYDGRANVNGEGGIDGNDLNKLINIILGK